MRRKWKEREAENERGGRKVQWKEREENKTEKQR